MTRVFVPTSGYLDNVELLTRALDHIDAGTTDLAPRTGRVPVAHYLDTDHLARELALLRRRPVPFCPSALLTESGSFHAREAAGVPIVVVRSRTGEVAAFRNACRHRGTALVTGSGCAHSFVCPFHGWIYALDGSLSHVPDAYGFEGIDLVDRGLVPVSAAERHGIIWVDQDGPGDFTTLDHTPGLSDDQIVVEEERIEVEGNWKVLTEGFMEGYHLRATHRGTFLPYGYDNITVVEHSGRNSRITFPFKRIEELRAMPREQWRIGGIVTVLDHLFPNAVLARLTEHTAMVIVEPISATRSLLVIYKVATGPLDAEAELVVKRDIAFIETGLREDRAMAVAVQRGLAARAGDVVFGRFESALTHLHEGLAAELGGGS
ncbi:MAG: aromatic ring-hydroxylating oxygenase subunit alpha [Sporichthyaceae bacterium]